VNSFNSPNYAFRPGDTGGFFYIRSPISYTTAIPDGDLVTFTDFTWSGVNPLTAGTIGFGADTPGSYMNVTQLTATQLTLMVSAGVFEVYTPTLGEPSSVTGGSSSYSGGKSTITVSSPGMVLLTFAESLHPISQNVNEVGIMMAMFLPLIAIGTIFGLAKYPGDWKIILETMIVITVLIIFGSVFYSWGL
jgi:hypothetical protein